MSIDFYETVPPYNRLCKNYDGEEMYCGDDIETVSEKDIETPTPKDFSWSEKIEEQVDLNRERTRKQFLVFDEYIRRL